jgi:hypothetical protein
LKSVYQQVAYESLPSLLIEITEMTNWLPYNILRILILVCLLTVPSYADADGRSHPGASDIGTVPVLFTNATYDQWQRMHIESIKQEILSKLGMTSIPDVSNINMTVEEHREILRKYKRSVEELQGRTFSPIYDEQRFANAFDVFTDNGNYFDQLYL